MRCSTKTQFGETFPDSSKLRCSQYDTAASNFQVSGLPSEMLPQDLSKRSAKEGETTSATDGKKIVQEAKIDFG